MMDFGKIEKMKLKAYSDNKFEKQVGEEFSLLINPETLSRKYALEYGNDDPVVSVADPAKYFKTKPEEFKLDILFDSTGVVKDASFFSGAIVNPLSSATSATDLTDQIESFIKLCIDINGENHRPNFIQVEWGTLLFKGVVMSLDFDYKLFSKDGKPIRAIAHLNLKSAIDPLLMIRKADLKSPDITHQRVFKASDHFALMTDNIYDNPNYYIDVARANKMLSFRKIEQGTKINFPPIK